MFGRKALPDRLLPAEAIFSAQAERVEAARRALLGCLPVGRVEPAPVAIGLDLLRDELEAVRAELPRWRVPEIEAAWIRCHDALDAALAAVEPARATAASTGELEELLGAVGEVVEPLTAWAEAEWAWRRLRVRVRRSGAGPAPNQRGNRPGAGQRAPDGAGDRR